MLRAKKMEPGNGERYVNTEIIPLMRKKDLSDGALKMIELPPGEQIEEARSELPKLLEEYDDRGGATGERGRQWRSHTAAGDRKGAAGTMDSDEKDGGRRDGHQRSSDMKSSRDGHEGTSDRYEDERHERYGREPELRSRVRVEGSDRERNRDKDRAEYEERVRFDSDRARHRYDPDRSRPEREKRQRTETYRSNRDDEKRDRSHLRMEIGRKRRKNDRDESRDYGRQVEGRDFSRVKDGEPGRNAEDSDIPPGTRNKESSGIEDNREFVCGGRRESLQEKIIMSLKSGV
ncbi:hypothetical protein R1flu_023495 [Riccia fluitans]|uniref:Uncharacterized protein n=1 Tax=Riccia fluitans TaxID=41844 RepID=A0ABD1XW89_9MARC